MDALRLGLGPLFLPVPGALWTRAVDRQAVAAGRLFAQLPDDHRRVRRVAVAELARGGRAVGAEHLARETGLSPGRVERILAELEAKLLFLYRDAQGAVEWAYPLTAAATPHRLRFSSGEDVFSA